MIQAQQDATPEVQNEDAAPAVQNVQSEAVAAPDASQGQAQNDHLQAPALTGEDKIKNYLASRNVKIVDLTVFFEALGLPLSAQGVRPLAPSLFGFSRLSESALKEGLKLTEIQISEVESALNYLGRHSGDYVLE